MNRTISLRLGAIAAASFAALAFASGPASADPTGGANTGCQAYAPWNVGQPSGNGVATTQPAAGTKGKADSKCPPGQAPDGTDHNKGYECDANQGVGKTNPAHSGCYGGGYGY
jgi:hypothetical protein